MLSDEQPTTLIIESELSYATFLHDLWEQKMGRNGEAVFSEREKEIQLNKSADIIWNPFCVDCNDRKVITKLYQAMKEQSDEMLSEKISEITMGILDYLEQMEGMIPYPLDYSADLDCIGLFKLMDVKMDYKEDGYYDNFVNYIKTIHRICGIGLFIFVSLKSYFTEGQLEEIYKDLMYEKVYILDIENVQKNILSCEKTILLDRDCCIIEMN